MTVAFSAQAMLQNTNPSSQALPPDMAEILYQASGQRIALTKF